MINTFVNNYFLAIIIPPFDMIIIEKNIYESKLKKDIS